MCKHEVLISRNTGDLVEASDLTDNDKRNNLYLCNKCRSLFEYDKDGTLIREMYTQLAHA